MRSLIMIIRDDTVGRLLTLLIGGGAWSCGEAAELRLGYFPNITHAQALYARSTGEFERKVGVKIQWVAFNAGPTVIESVFADAIDAAFVGPSPTINGYLKSRGTKFVIIAGTASGGAGLVVRKDSRIASLKDFANRTIATPQLGNTQDVAARVWLGDNGYRLRERGGNVALVPLSNPDQLTMFKKKQIDAAWTVEPWLSRLELEGDGEVLLEEKALWPEGQYATTHLIVNRNYLANHAEILKKMIRALVETTQHINADKPAAATLLNEQLKKETGKTLRADVMARAMARVEFTWDPICASLASSASAACRIGFIRKTPDLRGVYSLKLLNEVLSDMSLPPVIVPADLGQ